MNEPLIHSQLSDAEFWERALKETVSAIKDALLNHGTAHVGLSGGRSPKHLYELLAQEDLPWDKMTWILLDERMVPTEDPESNLGMIQNALLNQTPDAKVLSFNTALPQRDAAQEMAKELIRLSDDREPLFDLLILGAGKDGHVASLFEGDEAITGSAYASAATAQGYPTEARLTLGLIALENSKKALLLLQGEEKRPVLESLKGKGDLPLTALRHLMERVPVTVLTDLKP